VSRRRPHHLRTRSRRRIATAVTCACLALAPSAVARTDPPSVLPVLPATTGQPDAKPYAPTVIHTIDDGFDWGSAGIGAGVGAAIALLSVGGVRAGSRARLRPAR
jgi:hypothetical protein